MLLLTHRLRDQLPSRLLQRLRFRSPIPFEATPEVQDNAVESTADVDNAPELNAGPVSAVPSPGAVSDPKPEQTDNRERPEDGEQDVSQDPTVVPSEDEDPDAVA